MSGYRLVRVIALVFCLSVVSCSHVESSAVPHAHWYFEPPARCFLVSETGETLVTIYEYAGSCHVYSDYGSSVQVKRRGYVDCATARKAVELEINRGHK